MNQQTYQENFSSSENYAISDRYHLGVSRNSRIFNCPYCPYLTPLKGNLTTHLRKHTGERPFKCDLCDASFCTKHNLTVHRSTHNELKPYKCEFCNYSAAQNVSLKSHIIRHHGTGPQISRPYSGLQDL